MTVLQAHEMNIEDLAKVCRGVPLLTKTTATQWSYFCLLFAQINHSVSLSAVPSVSLAESGSLTRVYPFISATARLTAAHNGVSTEFQIIDAAAGRSGQVTPLGMKRDIFSPLTYYSIFVFICLSLVSCC